MGKCNGCEGSDVAGCCSPVMLPFSRLEAELAPRDEMEAENRRWVLEDLTPISRREGLRRTPYVKDGLTIYGNENTGETFWFWSHFYDCKHYDAATKRCMNYDNRPPMCRDFPWYGVAPDPLKSLPEHCSYRSDVTTVGVTIMDKLNSRRARGAR